jgi:hypothetical protein
MQRSTAKTIINRAAVELGLSTFENPFTDDDPNATQLYHLLNSLGERLAREYEWTHLKVTGAIVPVVAQTEYAFPVAFRRMVNQTGWDRTSTQAWIGPLAPEQWTAAQALEIVSTIAPIFRITGSGFEFLQTPANTLNYEYLTYYWVQGNGESELTASETADSDDTVWFDTPLMVAGLKLAFRDAKGLDTTSAQNAYDRALEHALSADNGAAVLNLSQPPCDWLPHPRLPETNWGT